MSDSKTIDLLEIYYARNLRDHIESELKRLKKQKGDNQDNSNIEQYYERMYLITSQLLHNLGD